MLSYTQLCVIRAALDKYLLHLWGAVAESAGEELNISREIELASELLNSVTKDIERLENSGESYINLGGK